MEEYQPSHLGQYHTSQYSTVQYRASPAAVCADDADAALDDTAGELIFMARTCVQENVGDFCSTGVKSGTQTAVTVCRSALISSSQLQSALVSSSQL